MYIVIVIIDHIVMFFWAIHSDMRTQLWTGLRDFEIKSGALILI